MRPLPFLARAKATNEASMERLRKRKKNKKLPRFPRPTTCGSCRSSSTTGTLVGTVFWSAPPVDVHTSVLEACGLPGFLREGGPGFVVDSQCGSHAPLALGTLFFEPLSLAVLWSLCCLRSARKLDLPGFDFRNYCHILGCWVQQWIQFKWFRHSKWYGLLECVCFVMQQLRRAGLRQSPAREGWCGRMRHVAMTSLPLVTAQGSAHSYVPFGA